MMIRRKRVGDEEVKAGTRDERDVRAECEQREQLDNRAVAIAAHTLRLSLVAGLCAAGSSRLIFCFVLMPIRPTPK